VREAEVGLEANTVVESALQDVGATKGMFNNRDAAWLYISFGEADSFVLVAQLSNQACKNVTLKESGIHVNVPSELATFIERVHCAFLCVDVDDFVL
jgi:hypothetical protein